MNDRSSSSRAPKVCTGSRSSRSSRSRVVWVASALLALSGCGSAITLGDTDSSSGVAGGATTSNGSASAWVDDGAFAQGVAHVIAGSPVALATGQDPLAIAVNGGRVYWTNADGSVHGALTSGEGAAVELSPGLGEPAFAIAVDATRVFWPAMGSLRIAGAPRAGGATDVLAEGVEAADLAVDGATVFFPEHGLRGVPASGGPVSWIMPCGMPPIALDATNAYFPFPDGASLRKVAKTGATSEVIATIGAGIAALAVFEDDAYVVTKTGSIVRVNTTTGDAPVEVSSGLEIGRIAVDATGIYATTARVPGPNRVLRIPLDGGAVTVLATDQRAPRAIALDADAVYWTNDGAFTAEALGGSGGAIMKRAKP